MRPSAASLPQPAEARPGAVAGTAGAHALQQLAAEIVACRACPRLVAHREAVAARRRPAYAHWTYWGRPVPGFGDPQARLLVVGLAPAAHGANRTGRMFTGDASGDWLVRALYRHGFANGPTSTHAEDGLRLVDAWVTASCRCAPPGNRPTAAELAACRPFLVREWRLLPRLRVVVALGRVAFDTVLRLTRQLYGWPPAGRRPAFAHGATVVPPAPLPAIVASYHPSRQNTQTGRLSEGMLDQVFATARQLLQRAD